MPCRRRKMRAGGGIDPGALYRQLLDSVTKFARSRSQSHHDAEEIASEAVARTWESLGSSRGLGQLEAWAVHSARNLHIDDCRARRRQRLADQDVALACDSHAGDEVAMRALLADLDTSLPMPLLDTLRLSLAGCSLEQAAAAGRVTLRAMRTRRAQLVEAVCRKDA